MPCNEEGLTGALLYSHLAVWQRERGGVGNFADTVVILSAISWKVLFNEMYSAL